jgi:predicted ATPase
MRLKRFAVKGFKNFRQEIVLEEMGTICVIHGENNVGKSNVLEAIQLFFQLFHQTEGIVGMEEFGSLTHFTVNEIFTLGSESPITMSATLALEPPEQASDDGKFYDINITLEKKSQQELKLTKTLSQIQAPWLTKLSNNPFALIGVDRRISDIEIETVRHIVPQTLLLKLYDAKDSIEPAIFEKWELFVKTLQKFNDVLGDGEFVSIFNRHNNRANLVFQSNQPKRRIPIEILGSGIQQVVALVARLLVSDASLVAIEEPELNLRYTLQLRLREILPEIVAAPVGPQQIFLTSHSPAFEFGNHFYAMKANNGEVTIKHLPIKQAHLFTEHDANAPNLGETAPQCYVSSDRLVRLPEDICQTLGIEQGGGIVIVKRKDNEHVELLTNEQFLDLLEPITHD